MNFIEQIHSAALKIAPYILKTPSTHSPALSELTQGQVYLKNEHLQYTGSFKLRGALNKILSLNADQKRNGVIAGSSGNHGLGVAYAAQLTGITATIFVPQNASAVKLKKLSTLGAQIQLIQGDCLAAETLARKASKEQQCTFISPYNDLEVIAGQGTLGIELYEQIKDLDMVFVSVGGGGLISGIAAYLKNINPKITIVGCWPKNSPILFECLKAGKIIDVPELETLSDGTAGPPEPHTITFSMCQQWIDQSILVTEEEIKAAICFIAKTESWMIEGSAAVAVASVIQKKEQLRGKKIAVLLCGRNIDYETFKSIIL